MFKKNEDKVKSGKDGGRGVMGWDEGSGVVEGLEVGEEDANQKRKMAGQREGDRAPALANCFKSSAQQTPFPPLARPQEEPNALGKQQLQRGEGWTWRRGRVGEVRAVR